MSKLLFTHVKKISCAVGAGSLVGMACLAVSQPIFAQSSVTTAGKGNPANVLPAASYSNAKKRGELSVAGKGDLSYAGHNVSLNFNDVETRTLLQLLAKTSGLNFVISDAVKGNMTLHVTDVPWDQALDIILKANGLGYRRFGKVLLIAPVNELATNEIQELQAKRRVAELAPLQSEIIRLRYANAEELANLLKGDSNSLLSSRGSVSAERRTNSLWLRDIPANLRSIRPFIQRLDVPSRQVLIEAKIVSIDKNYARDLGIRWGISGRGGKTLSGTFSGANQALTQPFSAVTPPTDRLNFNMPAAPISGANPASIALAMTGLGNNYYLDLELSALEEENLASTLSSPRVITSNQQPAYIQQGEEIPYLVSSSSGATAVEFKDAVMSLEITPQITPDDKIMLTIKVMQNTRGQQLVANSLGAVSPVLPPAINTREVKSQVLLQNNQTVVIGGIFTRDKTNNETRIPFLGKLPFIGALFRNRQIGDRRRELLIFITPRIITAANQKRIMSPKRDMEVERIVAAPTGRLAEYGSKKVD